MVIAVPRVVFAWHYPSDIIGSLVLGPGCVYLFNRISFLQTVVERALKLFENRMYVVHALLSFFWRTRLTCFWACKRSVKAL